MFHVSLLKPYKDDGRYQPPPPNLVDSDGDVFWGVESILAHRDRGTGKHKVREYLVAWEGFGPEHNSWEPEKNLKESELVMQEVARYHARATSSRPRTRLKVRRKP